MSLALESTTATLNTVLQVQNANVKKKKYFVNISPQKATSIWSLHAFLIQQSSGNV